MLLFVVQPDLDQWRQSAELVFASLTEEFDDRRIDMAAIGADLVGAGTGRTAIAPIPGSPAPTRRK